MSKPMTKTQLVAALAEAMGSDKKTAGAALDAIAEVVARKWPPAARSPCRAWARSPAGPPERQVRNPATGETMTKPADKQVKFAIAKALKDLVNG
jgi:DNA-binding protein HU-beta